jgi:hypothetical protein
VSQHSDKPESEQISLFEGTYPTVRDGAPPVVDERPEVLESRTYRLLVPFGVDEVDIYVTVSDRDGRPFEFFLNCSNMELSEQLAAISTLGSRMLRNGFTVEVVARDLMGIASPHTAHMRRGGYCQSLSWLIGRTLLAHAGGEPVSQR